MSTWNVLWSRWLQKGKKLVGTVRFWAFNEKLILNIMHAINHNKSVLHVCFCIFPSVFKEVLPVQLGFLPPVILEFSSLLLTKGNETPSSFPLPGPGPLIDGGVDQHERKCFTSAWLGTENKRAYLHTLYQMSPLSALSPGKKVPMTSQREGVQMWSEVCFCCTLHHLHIYFPNNFPIRGSGASMMALLNMRYLSKLNCTLLVTHPIYHLFFYHTLATVPYNVLPQAAETGFPG